MFRLVWVGEVTPSFLLVHEVWWSYIFILEISFSYLTFCQHTCTVLALENTLKKRGLCYVQGRGKYDLFTTNLIFLFWMERVSPVQRNNVARLVIVFKSLYSVSITVSQCLVSRVQPCNVFFTATEENQTKHLPTSAETDQGPNHLSSKQELPVSQIMRSSKRQSGELLTGREKTFWPRPQAWQGDSVRCYW